jgi:hypothetical protein
MADLKLHVKLLFLASVGVSLAVLSRPFFTELGVQSYGRVWQLYVSYFDFGFARRALVGTLLSLGGLNSLGVSEYVFAHVIHALMVVLVGWVVYASVRASCSRLDGLSSATIFLSPALIIHSGYSTGSLDVFVVLLALVVALIVESVWVFVLLLVIGLLVHELFFFTVPAQIVCYHIRMRESDPIFCRFNFQVLVIAVVLVVLISSFGVLSIPEDTFDAEMVHLTPHAAGKHTHWSGYFELSASVERNADEGRHIFGALVGGWRFLVLPSLYLFILIFRNIIFGQPLLSLVVAMVGCFPLGAILVATDVYRWIALSADVMLMMYIVMVRQNFIDGGARWVNWLLLSFFLVAPFGRAEVERPFPMQQFLLERIWHLSLR